MPDQIHPMRALQQQIGDALDVFYERIGRHHHAVSGQVRTRPIPAADQAATKSGFEYTLEIPGMNAADFEVVVDENRLTVRGEKTQSRKENGKHFHLRERHYGRFERSFRLPRELDTTATHAEYADGVIRITIPRKAGAAKTRKIPVTARRSK